MEIYYLIELKQDECKDGVFWWATYTNGTFLKTEFYFDYKQIKCKREYERMD